MYPSHIHQYNDPARRTGDWTQQIFVFVNLMFLKWFIFDEAFMRKIFQQSPKSLENKMFLIIGS